MIAPILSLLVTAAIQPKAPIASRWSQGLDASKAHQEYPRPQLRRKDWLNLNGIWDLEIDKGGYKGKVIVPFPVESALSGVMKRVRPDQTLTYRRTFTVPNSFNGKHTILRFEAVDYSTTVFVNGKRIGSHDGGYDSFGFDITNVLKPNSAQSLEVQVTDETGGFQPRGKQFQQPGGIWYTPTSGIWQTVWLEALSDHPIDDLIVTPDVDRGTVNINIRAMSPGDGDFEAIVEERGRVVAKGISKSKNPLELKIPNPKLWSPDSPFIYDLKVRLRVAGILKDEVQSYFGMRKIAVKKDASGVNRVELNNKPIFMVGTLDQGFWPDGIYTAPTDAALQYDVQMTKKLGFNTIRKHVKVEPQRWYYWCDRLGILVWQDMPSAHFVNENGKEKPINLEESKQFSEELFQLVTQHRNAPSIIMWVVFNEGWGQHDTPLYTKFVQELDPSRLVDNASGWTDNKVGSVLDWHSYPEPRTPILEPNRAAVLGEFGGLGLAVDGHTWSQQHWGYQGMKDQKALTERYVQLLRQAYAQKERGLNAVIYTQITDVETETNGLMTYDRTVLKVDQKEVANANRGIFPPPIPMIELARTAENAKVDWTFTLSAPQTKWANSDYDDSDWQKGFGGFGTAETPGAIVGTVWSGSDIWLRRTFDLTELPKKAVTLRMHHDENAEVYINGVLAAKVTGWTSSYEDFDLTPEARKALRIGKNTIAVHCHQTSGGQYIDVGLRARK